MGAMAEILGSNNLPRKLREMLKAEPPKVEKGQLTVPSSLGYDSNPKQSGTKLLVFIICK